MRANTFTRGATRFRLLSVAGLFLAVALVCPPALPGDGALAADSATAALVDLNSASLEEVLALPIPADLAQRIVDYRDYLRYFDNVYDLLEVDGMTTEYFAVLKPLVATMPPPVLDASLERLSASYRQVQRYLGQEGSSEGLVDEYLDKMRNPENINGMDIYDLMSYQNVSPVDATNIIKARDRLGKIENARQLRGSEGLRYYSYRNLRDFVVYSEDELDQETRRSIAGYAQTRYSEAPFSSDDDELGMAVSGRPRYRFFVDDQSQYQPGWLNKIRVNAPQGVSAGILTSRE
ncbi:MAG: helix-hairpin-helix domain-containing protein, partial [Gemmatimonadales bacterium]